MDRLAFRYTVDGMLVKKSKQYRKYVIDKIDKILAITKQDDMSLETVACIMLEADRVIDEIKDVNE